MLKQRQAQTRRHTDSRKAHSDKNTHGERQRTEAHGHTPTMKDKDRHRSTDIDNLPNERAATTDGNLSGASKPADHDLSEIVRPMAP